ncbi:MAG: hypothetical protein ACYDHW_01890 [Syntrophorhabdaceae bacterium]
MKKLTPTQGTGISNSNNEIWICWERPTSLFPPNAIVLSFLKPSDESRILKEISGNAITSGQLISQEVRDDAVEIYTNLVARVGAGKCHNGTSLREALSTGRGQSLWWYHRVSFKDCETDPAFNRIIEILVIDKITTGNKVGSIVLCGADDSIAAVLKTKYQVKCIEKRQKLREYNFFKTFISRLQQFAEHVYHWYLIRKTVPEVTLMPDVVLQGFWDWSVRSNVERGCLDDRYFKSLQKLLEQQGVKTAWFVWFYPYSKWGGMCRSAREILSKANSYDKLIFLQRYLNLSDIIKTFFNFRPAWQYLSFARSTGFKELFNHNGLNLFPLFRHQLLCDFISAVIPRHVLVEKACCYAFRKFRPKMALTFLEMFTYSRAFYQGAKQGYPEIKLATMQHASYCREKTFIRLEPEIEFHGNPDGYSMPTPDYVFAMGELGKKIFEEAGFPEEKVLLTGSSRYEDLSEHKICTHRESSRERHVLLVTSADRDLEMNMLEAVCEAATGLPHILLRLRSHPFAKMSDHQDFQRVSNLIQLTSGTLDEDLGWADLVIFTYSTVAEESLIKGIPVWQWRSAAYNGSVFRDLDESIPSFFCIGELREALKRFLKNPAGYIPTDELRRYVLRKCFYRTDGKSSERIAERIVDFISSPV